jgi:hypothetical protein
VKNIFDGFEYNFLIKNVLAHNTSLVLPKLTLCAADMMAWSREHCNKLKLEIEDCRRQIQNIWLNSKGYNQDQVVCLRKKMSRLLSQDDVYWRQRAKTH